MLYFLQGWLLLMFDVWTWNIQNCNCMDQKQLFSGFFAISFLNTFCYKFFFWKYCKMFQRIQNKISSTWTLRFSKLKFEGFFLIKVFFDIKGFFGLKTLDKA